MKRVKGIFGCILVFIAVLVIQLMVVLVLTIGAGLIYGIGAAIDGTTDPTELTNIIGNSMDINIIMTFQAIASAVCILIFGLWYYKKFVKKNRPNIKKVFEGKTILWIILLGLGMQLATIFILGSLMSMFPSVFDDYAEHMELLNAGNSLISLIFIVLIAPLSEELIFRGVIFNKAKKVMPFIFANVFQSILFGVMHGNIIQGTYAFFLGLLLGFIYERRQSIWAPIALHMAFNLMGTLYELIPISFFENYEFISIIFYILSIPAIAFSLIKLNKNPVIIIEENEIIEEEYRSIEV